MIAAIEQLVEQLLTEFGVQRVTVRVAVPDAVFPVRYEALAPGTGSLRDDTTDLTKQPVPRVLAEQGGQVVQDDSAAAFPDDAGFHEMRERYGGMRAQIVTGCYRDGEPRRAALDSRPARRRAHGARPSAATCRAAGDRDREDAR